VIELVIRWDIKWKKDIFFIICIILFISILFLLLSASKKVDRTASTELGDTFLLLSWMQAMGEKMEEQ